MTKYKSKKEKVRDVIEENFFFSDNEQESITEMSRAKLNLYCLRKYGATKGVVDSVLEMYVEAGALKANKEKIWSDNGDKD